MCNTNNTYSCPTTCAIHTIPIAVQQHVQNKLDVTVFILLYARNINYVNNIRK